MERLGQPRRRSRPVCPARAPAPSPPTRSWPCKRRGITPVVWWQPTNPANPLQGTYERYKRTLTGKHDAYITEWARAAKAAGQASGRRILLRYAHEATGYWFPWSVGRFDNTKESYKAAWRYVWKIFKREGALRYVRLRVVHGVPLQVGLPG